MKFSVQDAFIYTLNSYPENFVVYDGLSAGEFSQKLIKNRALFNTIKLEKFSSAAKSLFTYYGRTLVAYDFTIDSQENNTSSVDAIFLKKLLRGTDNIGFRFGNDRTREVKRQNRNYDTFDSLSRLMPQEDCNTYGNAENYIYPSTGLLRVNSLVNDFVIQNQHENLGSKDKGALTAEMNETITFTTKFTGNIDPSFTTDAITGRYVPSQLKLNVDNYRLDTHTIIILISLPLKDDKSIKFDAIGRITASDEAILSAKLDNIRINNYFDNQNKAALVVQRNNL